MILSAESAAGPLSNPNAELQIRRGNRDLLGIFFYISP